MKQLITPWFILVACAACASASGTARSATDEGAASAGEPGAKTSARDSCQSNDDCVLVASSCLGPRAINQAHAETVREELDRRCPEQPGGMGGGLLPICDEGRCALQASQPDSRHFPRYLAREGQGRHESEDAFSQRGRGAARTPRMVGSPQISGPLPAAELRRQIRRRFAELGSCAPASGQPLGVQIVLQISTDGVAIPERVAADGPASIGECVARILEAMAFAPAPSPTRVELTLRL